MPDYSLEQFIENYLENDEFPPVRLTQSTNFIGNGFLNKGANTNSKTLKEILIERLNLNLTNDKSISYTTNRVATNIMLKDNLYNNTWIGNNNSNVIWFENDTFINNTYYNSFLYDISLEYVALFTRVVLGSNHVLYARDFSTKSGTWTNQTPSPNNVWSLGTSTLNDYIEHTFNNVRFIMVQYTILPNTNNQWNFTIGSDSNNNMYRGTTPNAPPNYNSNTNFVSCAIFDLKTVGNYTLRITNKSTAATGVKSIDLVYAWGTNPSNANDTLILSPPKFDSRYSSTIVGFENYTPQRWRQYKDLLYCVARTMRAMNLPVTFYDIKCKCMSYTSERGTGTPSENNMYPSNYWFETVADEVIQNALKV